MKLCSVEGCEKARHVKIGLCSKHYAKYLKHGDPLGGRDGPPAGEPMSWINESLNHNKDQCLEWPYGKSRVGTGIIVIAGKKLSVFKVIGEMTIGDIEEGESYYHTCGNRRCCNHIHIIKMNKKERKQLQTSIWKKNNKDKVAEHCKNAYLKNPEASKARSRAWFSNNKEKSRIYSINYNKKREESDYLYKIRRRVSTLIKNGMKTKGFKKNGTKTERILGCTIERFCDHIEKQFTTGMNWGNHGHWHLDHILPISSAKSVDDIYALNHYTNFRPLWAEENIAKGASMDYLI